MSISSTYGEGQRPTTNPPGPIKGSGMKSLQSLVGEASAIERGLVESGGEITPEVEAWISSLNLEVAAKVDAYHFVIERTELNAGHWAAMAEKYGRVAKALSNTSSRMKSRLKQAMMDMGKAEVLGETVRYRLQNSAPSMIIDQESLPAEFLMQKIELVPDKERIKAAVKQGREIPGVTLTKSFALRDYVNKAD